MALTHKEETELEHLEAEFEEEGGRGVGLADRIDFLRAKSEHPTVTDVIKALASEVDPDNTFVVADDSDVEYPMRYISCTALLQDLEN